MSPEEAKMVRQIAAARLYHAWTRWVDVVFFPLALRNTDPVQRRIRVFWVDDVDVVRPAPRRDAPGLNLACRPNSRSNGARTSTWPS